MTESEENQTHISKEDIKSSKVTVREVKDFMYRKNNLVAFHEAHCENFRLLRRRVSPENPDTIVIVPEDNIDSKTSEEESHLINMVSVTSQELDEEERKDIDR